MDSETVFKLTEKRLNNLKRRNQSLEQLAVRLISKNLRYYLKCKIELEQLKNLPGALRNTILNGIMKRRCLEESGNKEEFADLIEAFPLLLSARTRYIELNGILSFCPDRCDNYSLRKVTACLIDMLDCIASRAPKVEVLVLRRHHAFEYDTRPEQAVPEILESLKKFRHLKRLHIELYMFGIMELLDFCEHVPSVQYLNVLIEEEYIAPHPEVIKKSLSNVKEFIYRTSNASEHLQPLLIKNLSNIEVAGFYCDVNTYKYPLLKLEEGYIPMGYEEGSNLRHLSVNLRVPASENGLLPSIFPNVEHLMLENLFNYIWDGHENSADDSYIDSLLNFTKIRSLTFGDFQAEQRDILEKFWSTYGANLHTLCFFKSNDTSSVFLKTIFKSCPKLEKLSLSNIAIRDSSLPIEFFAALKCFEWKFENQMFVIIDRDDPPMMILSNILSAPQLENVDLEGVMFSIKDLRNVNKLIQTRQILTHLRSFRFFYNYPSKNLSEFKAVTDIVKSASALLPKLVDLRFFASEKRVHQMPRRFLLSFAMIDEDKSFRDPFVGYRKYNSNDLFIDDSVTNLLDLYEREQENLQSLSQK